MSRAFVTGSRAYGKVKPNSDVDLVILCSEETKLLLTKLSENGKEPIRFGKLNLIICTSEEEYAVWCIGTKQLKDGKKKINKQEATKIFDVLRYMIGQEAQIKKFTQS